MLDGSADAVVLVGHSYGGVVITDAGAHPAVERLVYVCAFAVDEDETVIGVALDHEEQPELAAAIAMHDDGTSTLDPALVGAALYGDCDARRRRAGAGSAAAAAAASASPSPRRPWRGGTSPTTYVVCGADRAVPPSLQRTMAERIPDVALVEWPDGSHSPFLSRPGDVVDLLAGLAARREGPRRLRPRHPHADARRRPLRRARRRPRGAAASTRCGCPSG